MDAVHVKVPYENHVSLRIRIFGLLLRLLPGLYSIVRALNM